jgi:hypothetical protein
MLEAAAILVATHAAEDDMRRLRTVTLDASVRAYRGRWPTRSSTHVLPD